MNNRLFLCFLTGLTLIIHNAWADDKSPNACTDIADDRSRLICFDRLHKTPVHPINIENTTDESMGNKKRPIEWQKAWEKDKKRTPEDAGFILNISPGSFLDSVTLTLPLEDTGLLVLSCIDKISRIELMLDHPVKEGIVPVTIEGKSVKKDNWLSDDTGYILRMGRGIPSIDVMKNMLDQNYVYLQFNGQSKAVSTGDLSEKIKSLRNICRW